MKNIKAPKLVTIAVLTLITAVFWAGFEVYRIFTQKPTPPVPQTIINPINPTLDQNTLNSLQGRMYLDESQIGQTIATTPAPVAQPTPPPAPTPNASPSATLSPSPVASSTPTP